MMRGDATPCIRDALVLVFVTSDLRAPPPSFDNDHAWQSSLDKQANCIVSIRSVQFT